MAAIAIYGIASLPGSTDAQSPGPYRSQRELSLTSLVGLVITVPTYFVGSRDRQTVIGQGGAHYIAFGKSCLNKK